MTHNWNPNITKEDLKDLQKKQEDKDPIVFEKWSVTTRTGPEEFTLEFNPVCNWTHERTLAVDGYSTSCKQIWYLGGMIYQSSLIRYCPFCGKRIEIKETK